MNDPRSLSVVAVALAACGAPSLIHRKPDDPETNHAVTAMWSQEIRQVARDGDWILTRSYSAIGDAIVLGTRGAELSHASIYDAERGVVIEAVSSGIREVPLEQLLERNRVVVVLRPRGLDQRGRQISVRRARAVVGGAFDSLGMFGIDVTDRFYCTELVAWASGVEIDAIVITPPLLLDYGDVVYQSGNRDDPELQQIARSARSSRPAAARPRR